MALFLRSARAARSAKQRHPELVFAVLAHMPEVSRS
jgi:hypothetical protein